MELDDPNLPPFARSWALIGADAVSEWVERAEGGVGGDAVEDLAVTLLIIIEQQAKVIAEMAFRIERLASD